MYVLFLTSVFPPTAWISYIDLRAKKSKSVILFFVLLLLTWWRNMLCDKMQEMSRIFFPLFLKLR